MELLLWLSLFYAASRQLYCCSGQNPNMDRLHAIAHMDHQSFDCAVPSRNRNREMYLYGSGGADCRIGCGPGFLYLWDCLSVVGENPEDCAGGAAERRVSTPVNLLRKKGMSGNSCIPAICTVIYWKSQLYIVAEYRFPTVLLFASNGESCCFL